MKNMELMNAYYDSIRRNCDCGSQSVSQSFSGIQSFSEAAAANARPSQPKQPKAPRRAAATRAIIWARVCRRPGILLHFINIILDCAPESICFIFSVLFCCFFFFRFFFFNSRSVLVRMRPAASELLDSMLMHEL